MIYFPSKVLSNCNAIEFSILKLYLALLSNKTNVLKSNRNIKDYTNEMVAPELSQLKIFDKYEIDRYSIQVYIHIYIRK